MSTKSNVSMRIAAIAVSILFSLVILYPIVFIMLVSLKDNKEFYTNIWGLPQVARWSNYVYAWYEGQIQLYAGNSIIVTVSAVAISLLFSMLAGYALAKLHIPKSELIVSILMGLNFIPGVAVYVPLYIQLIKFKLTKTLLMLIIPYAAWQLPFSIYIFKKFYATIPSEILESARVDGSGELRTFFTIITPLVTPAIATVIVFNFVSIWGEFLWANIASSSSNKIQTLPVGLLNFKGEYGIEWGPFGAAIITIIAPLFIVFVYFQKYFIQGLSAGAVKG